MPVSTLIRADIVSSIVKNVRVSDEEARDVLESVLKEISQTLTKGEHVKIPNFGKFSVRKKNERLGRNPRTCVESKISARRVVTFKYSRLLLKKSCPEEQ